MSRLLTRGEWLRVKTYFHQVVDAPACEREAVLRALEDEDARVCAEIRELLDVDARSGRQRR